MKRLVNLVLIVFLGAAVVSTQAGPNDARAREIYKELVEINTTDTPAGNVTKAAEAVAARLKAAGFPAADIQVIGPDPRKGNLVFRYRGSSERKPLLLLAHLDVVEARRADWSMDPFTFVERDGFFYGRGTSDDKAMASQFIANLLRLKEEGFKPDRDLILALTADEEGGDFNGAEWLVKNHRDLIDAEFAINEGGSGGKRKGKYVTNEVQASEKVYQDFRLEVTNAGGHSSLPVRDNAIYRLSAGLARLSAYEFPVELNEVTRAYFERSAAVEPDPKLAADMRAVARPKTDLAAAARLSASLPYYNAMMRTTCVATTLLGGHALNALPQLASANVNCRILPGVSAASVKTRLVEILSDPKIAITSVNEARPSRPSPLRPDVMTLVESLTSEIYPGAIVVPVMSTGATDGLFLRNGEIPTYGVGGTFGDLDDVRWHGKDERVGVKEYFEALEFQVPADQGARSEIARAERWSSSKEVGLTASEAVSLQRATPDMAPLLQNLLQLYIHDMSGIFPVELGPEGRFGYEKLALYWAEPAERHAFVIKAGGRVAGFALATRGSPATDTPTDFDVAEFFVLRAYRRSGVGRHAAFMLWDGMRGQWVVRVSEANRTGLQFWSEVIRAYTSGVFGESTRPGGPGNWRIFTFASRPPAAL